MLMKVLLSLLTILCAVAMIGPAFAEIDPKSVVAVWLCDEGAGDVVTDTSGNGHDGDFVGDIGWTDGKFGKALEFLGSASNRVEVPHDDSLTLGTWTISAWVKLMSAGDWAVVVVKDLGNGTQNYSLDMDGGGRVFAEVTSGGSWSDCGSVTTVYDDEWHFTAASYDGSDLRVYVDGNMENEQNFAAGDENTAPVAIGGRVDGSQPLLGIVDDIGLLNVALSEDDLTDIMNNGLDKALGLAAVEPKLKSATTWGQLKQR